MKTVKDPIQPPASTPDINVQNIASRIKPVAESTGPIAVLLYGRSGTGKTTIAGTFPAPVLLLDIGEQGTDSICDIPGIDVLKVECWEDVETIYWFLRAGKHKYNTVVIDTVTQMQKLAMEYTLVGDGKETTSPMNKNLWGQTSKLMAAWLINYKDLPLNTVFLAQDRTTADEETREDQVKPEVGPRLMPSVAAILNASVRVIGQTYIKEFRKGTEKTFSFRLRIGPHSYYLTKIRKVKNIELPESIHNPSYEKLMKIIHPKTVEEMKPVETPT